MSNVRSYLRITQARPKLVKNYFRERHVQYAAHLNSVINTALGVIAATIAWHLDANRGRRGICVKLAVEHHTRKRTTTNARRDTMKKLQNITNQEIT